MDLQLRRRLTHLLALMPRGEGPLARRGATVPASACRPGLHQELLPRVERGGVRQCLALPEGARTGTEVSLTDCTPENAARTRYWRGHVLLGQCACLDVAAPTPGAPAVAKRCRRRRLWRRQDHQLRYGRSNLCLDHGAALATPGAPIAVASCNAESQHQAFDVGTDGAGPWATSGPTSTPAPGPTASATSRSAAPPATSSAPAGGPPPRKIAPDGYRLLWEEAFSGPGINTSRWNFVIDCANANNELQCYTDRLENAHVADGLLHIDVIKEPYGGRDYTSARINTYGKFDFTYGYIEATLKLPCGRGLWPAFWLMPTSGSYGPWPQSGELDIMEFLGATPNTVTAAAHFGWDSAVGHTKSLANGTFCDAFHTFGLNWTEGAVAWSLDGVPHASLTALQGPWAPAPHWPFDQAFYVILNVAMGGNWPGPPDPNVTGGTLLVDAVRVYQRP